MGQRSEGAEPRIISGRTGAMVMRSVSIFLASGRKVSCASRKQQSGSSTDSGGQRHGGRRRGRMPEDSAIRNAAQHARLVEALKKRTRFSKYGGVGKCSACSGMINRRGFSLSKGFLRQHHERKKLRKKILKARFSCFQ